MKQYLLDTSICVFLFRGNKDIFNKLENIGYRNCHISDVTVAELKRGAYKSQRIEENLQMINNLIRYVSIIPFADGIDFYAKEVNRLKKLGTPVEDFDLLIASAAISKDMIMVTDNTRHFERIEGIQLENWIER